MRIKTFAVLSALSATALGCRTTAAGSKSLDSSIVVSGAEDQRATAFCWAYAISAHLEQRYYELTRGQADGPFRLNFSEEYLGLIHLVEKLTQGEEPDEGLRLSDSLALVDKYGTVPEKIGNRAFFKPVFDTAIGPRVNDAALAAFPGGTRIPLAQAVALVARTAELTPAQTRFLAAAMGAGPEADARFQYARGTYTPKTWARDKLRFSKDDYYVLNFPDSGRGQEGNQPFTDEYLRTLKIVKKALLYGYSVPISFNIIRGSQEKDGLVSCVEPGCWDAELSSPTPDWPHANHAVLLIDYRSSASAFGPATAGAMQASYDEAPLEWVVKNSWGMNYNTSRNAQLLRRFPLPAYTVFTAEFLEASHKLNPGRYEAIVPRRVCFGADCKPLVTSPAAGGTPSAEEADVTLDVPTVLAHADRGATSRFAVTFDAQARDLGDGDATLRLATPRPRPEIEGFQQVNVVRETTVQVPDERFNACAAVQAGEGVSYVALYVKYVADDGTQVVPNLPYAVLSAPSAWQDCTSVRNLPRDVEVFFQPLDRDYHALGTLKAHVVVHGP